MDRQIVVISVSLLLLILLFSSGFFKTTGFLVNDQKLLISLEIPPDQQRIEPGQSLLLEVTLRVPNGNLNQTSNIDLEYSIRDLTGNLVSSKKESGSIAVKESVVTSLLIPTNTKPGVYRASVSVSYEGETYEASKTFEVSDRFGLDLKIVVYFLVTSILLLLLFIIIKKLKNRPIYQAYRENNQQTTP